MKELIHPQLGKIRCEFFNGEPFFVMEDVCKVLHIQDMGRAFWSLEQEE